MTRLTPKAETIRKLYLYSGNECAFKPCNERLFNDDGVYVAELAHIEAAELGGPRYNDAQTDEQRRHYDNLLLLCHKHHKVTDDISEYPVSAMEEMKRTHEARFGDNALRRMREALQDLTDSDCYTGAFTLASLDALEGYGFGAGSTELVDLGKGLREFADRLARIPVEHRSILRIILSRGRTVYGQHEVFEMTVHELVARVGMEWNELHPRLSLLQRYEFIEIYLSDEEVEEPSIQTRRLYLEEQSAPSKVNMHEIFVWSTIQYFCAKTQVPMSEIFDNLNFEVFD